MSTVSAFSGDTYSTRHRSASGGVGSVASRSMHQKNAARVLPLPVGADISVCCPAATARQPPSWTSVGEANVLENQARAAGENRSRTVGMDLSLGCRISIPAGHIHSPLVGEGQGGGSKVEPAQQLLRSQVAACREDGAAGIEQPAVVGRRASDPLTEAHDLAVQVIEFAARAALEAL